MASARRARHGFIHKHSLTLILAAIVAGWLLLYLRTDPATHAGAFFGNAVADWLGTLVFIIATKYFYEVGSKESRRPHPHLHRRIGMLLVRHSLTIVLALTGLVWLAVYVRSDPDSRAGQVVGSITSEWTQILGLVVITKYAREAGSPEGG